MGYAALHPSYGSLAVRYKHRMGGAQRNPSHQFRAQLDIQSQRISPIEILRNQVFLTILFTFLSREF